MYVYTGGIDGMIDIYNKGLEINRSMDIYNYTSTER